MEQATCRSSCVKPAPARRWASLTLILLGCSGGTATITQPVGPDAAAPEDAAVHHADASKDVGPGEAAAADSCAEPSGMPPGQDCRFAGPCEACGGSARYECAPDGFQPGAVTGQPFFPAIGDCRMTDSDGGTVAFCCSRACVRARSGDDTICNGGQMVSCPWAQPAPPNCAPTIIQRGDERLYCCSL